MGEESPGKKFIIEILFGSAEQFIDFDRIKRTIEYQPKLDSSPPTAGSYHLEILLTNSRGGQTLYGITIDLTCSPEPPQPQQVDSFTPEFSKNPPRLFIESIDSKGFVTIKSDTKLDSSAAFNTTELTSLDSNHHETRLLSEDFFDVAGFSEHVPTNYSLIQNSTVVINSTELASIELSVSYFEPAQDCFDALGFRWELVEFFDKGLRMRLLFDNAHCVSSTSNIGDTLTVTFNDQRLFRDAERGSYVDPGLTIERAVPRQMAA